jgi:lambda family phage portal protein
MKRHWVDRLTTTIAPRWTLRRERARIAGELLVRHYEGAALGRRTQGWRKSAADPNAAIGPSLDRLRSTARDLIRNNPYADAAISTICDHTVGWGIVAKHQNAQVQAAWMRWAESTDCDADGRHNFYGLQKLIMRAVAGDGEVLVRRRIRQQRDNFEIPLQLQVLEADFLDTTRDTTVLTTDGQGVSRRIIQGVEFDPIGRRTAYYLFDEHPGSPTARGFTSNPVPAESILHVFSAERPGQVRGPSWFAPVMLRFKDFDEFEDATLMKQKIAACLSVLVTDPDGSAIPLGTSDDTQDPGIDSLEPGMIMNMPSGREVTIVDPPTARDYKDFCEVSLRGIASGLGCTYEDLTGDYTELPFSAARMSRLRHWARVDDWRWCLIIPQFCSPVWDWWQEVASVAGAIPTNASQSQPKWSAPPMPMIEPDKEGLAYQRNIRTGIITWSESVRERGYDPADILAEMKKDNAAFDKAGIVLDSDARKTTQAGQFQSVPATPQPAAEPAAAAPTPARSLAVVGRVP